MSKKTIAELQLKGSGGKQVAGQLDQVGKATDRLGRQQTRLGQASASAGRQFSAQANGLGGLVGAYAGAAATVFALTAAFEALNRAARSEQIIAGTNALAASLGLQGQAILKNIQEITKGQLTLVESAEAANIALSAGLGQDQIEGLTKVAFKASRALGRSLTDSFTRLTRGVAKLEPELLDELGIFTRIEPAAEAYAKTIGKTAAQLTNFEKRQAFANEAIGEGTSKFKDVDTESATAAEALEKLAANLQDIGTTIGLTIAKFITPLVETFGSGLPAAFLAASTARLIFGKAIETLQAGLGGVQSKVDDFADSLVKKVSSAARVGKKELAALSTETGKLALNQSKGTRENQAAFNSLVKLAKAQKLTREQAGLLVIETERQIRLDATRIAVLRKKQALSDKEQSDLARLVAREKELNAVRERGIAVQNAQNAAIVRFGKVVQTGGRVLIGFGRGILALVNIAATITTIVAVFGTLVTSALDFLGLLDPLTDKLGNFIDEFRKAIGFSPDDILARDTIEAIAARLDTGVADEFRATNRGIRKVFEAGGYRSAEAFTAALAEELGTTEDKITQAVGPIIDRLVEQFQFLTKERQVLIGSLAEGLGQDAGAVANQLEISEKGIRFAEAAALKFNNRLQEAGDTTTKLGQLTNRAAVAALGGQRAQIKLQEALNAGGVRNETLDKLRAASKNRIIELEKALGEAITERQRKEIAGKLNLAKLEDADLSRRQVAQAAINQNADALRKQFSAQITAFSKINGLLQIQNDGTVRLSKSVKEQRAAQTAQLVEAFELGKDALELQRAGIPIRGIQVNLADRAAVAEKALVGQFVKSADQLKKINEELDKRNKKLQESIDKAKIQADLVGFDRQARLNKEGIDSIKRIGRLEQENFNRAQRRRELDRQAQKTARDAARDLEKFQTQQMGAFLGRDAQRELEIKFASEDIDILAKQINEDIKAMNDFARERRFNTEVENAMLEDQKRIATERSAKELELANIQKDTQINALRLEETKIKTDLELIEIEAKAFQMHVDGIARVLAADLSARQLQLEGEGFGAATAARATDATLSNTQKADINRLLAAAGGRGIAADDPNFGRKLANQITDAGMTGETQRAINSIINQTDVAGQVGEVISKPLARAKEQANLFSTNIDDLDSALTKLNNEKSAEKLASQLSAIDKQIQANQDALNRAEEDDKTRLQELNNQLSALETQKKLLQDLNNQNSIYNTTLGMVGTTINDSLTGAFMNLNQQLINGTLTIDSIGRTFDDMLGNMLRSIQQQVFQESIAKPIASGITGFIGGLFNSGGPVHLAGGGTLKRDRIPAMLEPGEFVIRKEAAKKLGMTKLQELNAGIRPDPMAMLIARLGGSKVRQAIGGGGGAMGGFGKGGANSSEAGGHPGLSDSSASNTQGMAGGFAGTAGGITGGPSGSGATQGTPAGSQEAMMIGKTQQAMQQSKALGIDPTGTMGQLRTAMALAETEEAKAAIEAEMAAKQATMDRLAEAKESATRSKVIGTAINTAIALSNPKGQIGLAAKGINAALGMFGLVTGKSTPTAGNIAAGDTLGMDDIGDMLGQAGGGLIHMAAGGAMKRDRVPALLEPGEFVIRKPMAKAIGGAALGQMNSTGKMTPGDVSVNINNSGSPKDVSVGTPKFNGDKYVIDIVTRDLRNNGALRKSLRGGSAG